MGTWEGGKLTISNMGCPGGEGGDEGREDQSSIGFELISKSLRRRKKKRSGGLRGRTADGPGDRVPYAAHHCCFGKNISRPALADGALWSLDHKTRVKTY